MPGFVTVGQELVAELLRLIAVRLGLVAELRELAARLPGFVTVELELIAV